MLDYDLWYHSVRLISGANLADRDELEGCIDGLQNLIGTKYYDDLEGDELMQHIVTYLSHKLEAK